MMCLCALDVRADWVSGGGGRGRSGGNAMGVALGVSGFKVFVVGQEGGAQDTGVRLNYIDWCPDQVQGAAGSCTPQLSIPFFLMPLYSPV